MQNKNQWRVVTSLILILIVVIFAVINVETVTINLLFTKVQWPLILVIVGSLLIGSVITMLVSTANSIKLKKDLKTVQKSYEKLKENHSEENEGKEIKKD